MMRMSLLSALLLLALIGPSRSDPAGRGLQDCVSEVSPDQRQKCDEEALREVKTRSRTTQLDGGWRLVMTRDPNGGADAVSAMHVVDTAKSDIGLAGLSLQCGRDGIEVVLIVLERLPRATRLGVILTAGSRRTEFEAAVVQGGEALLLPKTASNLAAGEWQSATELAVEIATKPAPIRGAVPIGGLSNALRYLSQHCSAR